MATVKTWRVDSPSWWQSIRIRLRHLTGGGYVRGSRGGTLRLTSPCGTITVYAWLVGQTLWCGSKVVAVASEDTRLMANLIYGEYLKRMAEEP